MCGWRLEARSLQEDGLNCSSTEYRIIGTVKVKRVVERSPLIDSSELQGLHGSYYLHDCCIKSTEMIYWPEDIDMTGSWTNCTGPLRRTSQTESRQRVKWGIEPVISTSAGRRSAVIVVARSWSFDYRDYTSARNSRRSRPRNPHSEVLPSVGDRTNDYKSTRKPCLGIQKEDQILSMSFRIIRRCRWWLQLL